MESHLPLDIGLCIIAAAALSYPARWARQPLLLAYIAAGVLIGPVGFRFINDVASIQTLAELGLAFLLFIVGLEIDVRKLLESGRMASIVAVVQVTGCVLLGWGAALLLGYAGLPAVYLGVAAAFSSTMIVVKHLADRSELDTLPGRVVLGILLVQDVLAVIALAIQPSIGALHGGVTALLLGFGGSLLKGFTLVGGALVVGRYVLPLLLRSVAMSPEILLVSAVSWCFLACWAAIEAGFSSAVGALLAGVSISSLPYSIDVVAKILPLRDFFLTLFFVSLGMLLPVPTPQVIITVIVLSTVVVAGRFLTIPVMLRVLGYDNRVGLIGAIHLSQISEFALVIMMIGTAAPYHHIGQEIVSVVVMILVVTATVSAYLVKFSHPIVRGIVRWTGGTILGDPQSESSRSPTQHDVPIVLVGCFRVGSSLVQGLLDSGRRFKVIDFNPTTQREFEKLGVPCVYGDISHLDTLEHAGVESAEVLISSIPDDFLRGTSNRKLLASLRRLNSSARILVTAESIEDALALYTAGADYVTVPRLLTADRLLVVLDHIDAGDLDAVRERELAELRRGAREISHGGGSLR